MDFRQTAPRSIGDILDVTIRIYRATFSDWWPWGVAFAVMTLVTGLLLPAALTGIAPKAPAEVFAALASPRFIAAIVATAIGYVWLFGALLTSLNGAYVGEPVSLGRAAASGGRLVLPFLGLGMLTGLATLLGAVLLIVPGLIIAGRLALGNTVLVIERRGVFEAIDRSWTLTRGHWWRSSTVLFVGSLIIGLLAAIVVIVLVAIVTLVFRSEPALASLLTLAVQAISRFFTTAFVPILGIVLYHDLKTRADGDDLERRAETLGSA